MVVRIVRDVAPDKAACNAMLGPSALCGWVNAIPMSSRQTKKSPKRRKQASTRLKEVSLCAEQMPRPTNRPRHSGIPEFVCTTSAYCGTVQQGYVSTRGTGRAYVFLFMLDRGIHNIRRNYGFAL
jgi:hypothetical protein